MAIGSETTASGRDFLLLIGINAYTAGLPRLNNAVGDAQAIGQALTNRFQFGDSDDWTHALYDDKATKEDILQQLEFLRQEVTDTDNVIIYFAGHGWYDPQEDVGYWLPVDAEKGKKSTFLSFSVLRDSIKTIRSWHTVILSDSCYAGTLFQERDIMGEDIALEKLAQYPSRYILAAGRNEPVSDGPVGHHSPFASGLLQILNNHRQGMLPVTELTMLLIRAVGANAKQMPRGEPMRDVGHAGGVFMLRPKGQEPLATRPLRPNETEAPVPPRGQRDQDPNRFASANAIKKALYDHLRAGDLDRFMNLINRVISYDSYYFNDILMLQARYNRLSQKARKGLLYSEEETVTRNRIQYSALEYVEMLKDTDFSDEVLYT